MKSQMVIQDLDLILNGVGENRYSLYVYDHHSNIEYTLRFKSYAELEDRLIVLFSIRHGVPHPKVLFLINGFEDMELPYMNDKYFERHIDGSYMHLKVKDSHGNSRILYSIMNHFY